MALMKELKAIANEHNKGLKFGLLATFEVDRNFPVTPGYASVFVRIVVKKGDDEWAAPDAWGAEELVSQFRVQCQCDERSVRYDGPDCRTYGWDMSFGRVANVTPEKAEWMGQFFKTARKAYEKTVEQFGRPTNFGAYVVYMMNALGIDTGVFRADCDPSRTSTFQDGHGKTLYSNGYQHRELNRGSFGDRINDAISAWNRTISDHDASMKVHPATATA